MRFICIVYGVPLIFFLVVIAVFQTIFAAGQPLSKVLQDALDYLGTRRSPLMSTTH